MIVITRIATIFIVVALALSFIVGVIDFVGMENHVKNWESIGADLGASRATKVPGQIEWQHYMGSIDYPMILFSSPAVADLTNDGYLEVVTGCDAYGPSMLWCYTNHGNGVWEVLWTFYTDDETRASPAIADIDFDSTPGNKDLEIAFGTTSGRYAYEITHAGTELWRHNFYQFVAVSPTLTDLIPDHPGLEMTIGSHNTHVKTFDPTGTVLWDFQTGSIVYASPAIGDLDGDSPDPEHPTDLEVVIGSYDGKLYCLDHLGGVVWNFDMGCQIVSSAAIVDLDGDGDLEIFVGGTNGILYKLDHTGLVLAQYDTGSGGINSGGSGYDLTGIQSSPAVGDIDFDGEYEIIVGANDKKVYCFDENLNLLWDVLTGGPVVSSAAIADLDRLDNALDIFIGSDDGNVYVLDNEGNVQWTFHGGGRIRAQPAVADVDLDGVLEMMVGSTNEKFYVVDTGASCDVGAVEWGMFRHDCNHTGVYIMEEKGVELTPAEEDIDPTDPMSHVGIPVHYVEPGDTTVFELRAWNVGILPATICVDFYGVPENWSAMLTPTELADIASLEYGDIYLYVTAPAENVSYGDFAQITVKAWLKSDVNVSDTLATLTIINVTVDFELTFPADLEEDPETGDKILVVNPRAKVIISAMIMNRGNINDSYNIWLEGIQGDWDIKFTENKDTVTKRHLCAPKYSEEESMSEIEIYIVVPDNVVAGSGPRITIAGESILSIESVGKIVEDSDTLQLIVSESYLLMLECDPAKQKVAPGATAIYAIAVINNGNTFIDVSLEHNFEREMTVEEGDNAGGKQWSVALEPTSVIVQPGVPSEVTLAVTAPTNALAADSLSVEVTACVTDNPKISAFISTTTEVLPVYDIAVSAEPTRQEVSAGSEVKFNISVRNLGNVDATIKPSALQLEREWDKFWFEKLDGSEIEDISIGPYETENFTFNVIVPTSALNDSDLTTMTPDPYKILVNVSCEEKSLWDQISLYIDVTQKFGVCIAPFGSASKLIGPGDTAWFMFNIINEGNGIDSVTINVSEVLNMVNVDFDGYIRSLAAINNMESATEIIEVCRSASAPHVEINLRAINDKTRYDIIGKESELKVIMNPRQSIWAYVGIYIPPYTLANTYTLEVSVRSSGVEYDLTDNCVSILIDVRNAELIVVGGTTKGIRTIGIHEDGELITVQVLIRNIGHLDAENVKVNLEIDDEYYRSETIRKIAIGCQLEATFTWRAEAGTHKLKIIVDPENRIIETDDYETNYAEKELVIKSKPSWFGGVVEPIYLYILILAIICAGLMMLFALRGRRSRSH